jgi:hypothetical protein
MSSLFKHNPSTTIHIGSMDLNQLREYHKNLSDEKEIERCPEAAFLNNDKQQTYKVISQTLHDVLKEKRRASQKQ